MEARIVERPGEVDRMIRSLDRLPNRVADTFGPAAFAAVQQLESKLRGNVPVGSTRSPVGVAKLRDSIASYRRSRRIFGRQVRNASAICGVSVSYTHLTLPTIYSV